MSKPIEIDLTNQGDRAPAAASGVTALSSADADQAASRLAPDGLQSAGAVLSVRNAFVARFGEDQASAIEHAAESHANGVNSTRRGDDPFKWALLIAIGYECMSKDGYREYHGITAPWSDIKPWIVEHADLASHVGDVDYLSLLTGSYNEFIPASVDGSPKGGDGEAGSIAEGDDSAVGSEAGETPNG